MNGYGWIVGLHVAVAVLGTGQVAAIAILAGAARGSAPDGAIVRTIGKLASTAVWSLVLLLLTGGLVMYLGGAFVAGMWWFRISVALFVVLGALNGQIRRALRRAGEASLRRIERLAWAMCVLVFVIVVLMEAKPW